MFSRHLNMCGIARCMRRILHVLRKPVYFGRDLGSVPGDGIVFFPLKRNVFYCGLAGILSFQKEKPTQTVNVSDIEHLVETVCANNITTHPANKSDYLGGEAAIQNLLTAVRLLKTGEAFYRIFNDEKLQASLRRYDDRLKAVITTDSGIIAKQMGNLQPETVAAIIDRLEILKDIEWCITSEVLENIHKVCQLGCDPQNSPSMAKLLIFKKINSVLNSIDRLEVRGRDSAGISIMFWMDPVVFAEFESGLNETEQGRLFGSYQTRLTRDVLLNQGIDVSPSRRRDGKSAVAITFAYKFASEVGSLGDNISFLRKQILSDEILHYAASFPIQQDSVCAHTRWASVGAINECNCHPVDNHKSAQTEMCPGVIHVCLNGDIDNYMEIKQELEGAECRMTAEITTDTKIIPLLIENYIQKGETVVEAFRKAVNRFEGSHAITMHTDLAPGKLFLAQKGSGQTIFVGFAEDFYMSSSEVYGFVEETDRYIKMDGEKVVDGRNGKTQGQIFVLDQSSFGGLSGVGAVYYDGTPITLTHNDIKQTRITSRDIDRQGFPHYYFKEISESPVSVEKTLENRWRVITDGRRRYGLHIDDQTIPPAVRTALMHQNIRRIYFVGQGTAGVAAQVCADVFSYFLNDPHLQVKALKASEMSGFLINDSDDEKTFKDALVVAISQSGTTTDTNRTVDMVRERGAYTLAIVNRRDSDLTFKVDGVMYTSSGRDIEMSVASTKAFYSQIVAGTLLGLFVAGLTGARNDAFISEEIKQLLAIPEKMRRVLARADAIGDSARRIAAAKTYWAVVGSGPNKASADEIRIKLSELCYKTISTDYVEDKKHIDLSSEPLIIVCAAGTRQNVLSDIIKDCAIFQAHKAAPIIIADEGETRFDPYALDVFHVPPVSEHLSPILNTLVGHIWGYHAALAINEASTMFYRFREDIRRFIDEQSENGLDVYEVVLDKTFREKIAAFYSEFRNQKSQHRLPAFMGINAVSDLTLLLKYLSGRLPVTDFELDFGEKGTASNMLNILFECIGESISCLSRPVDAIKHQAKTVTVGTSRIREKVEGILFEACGAFGFGPTHLTNSNVMVLKNLQGVVEHINGAILYKIDGLNLLGEPTDETTINILRKTAMLKNLPSRVETDSQLKGTKRIIVRQGNVYIGKGRTDGRSILVIPFISTDADRPNMIEHLLLLNISFRQHVPTQTKVKALGGKFENIKSIVQENSIIWEDDFLDRMAIEDLFGLSAEKVGEFIVSSVSGRDDGTA
ncbi:MAG: SIS domain-containing protein [Desulfobacterales bacterium]